jgi:hypothetical protein
MTLDASASPRMQCFQSEWVTIRSAALLLICGTDVGMAAVSCGNPQSAVGIGGRDIRITLCWT